MISHFDTKIEFLKGVGPIKAAILNKDIGVFTFGDLIQHYPFRHEDRTIIHTIAATNEEMTFVQLKCKVVSMQLMGEGGKKRLVACIKDGTGIAELIWFQSIAWISKNLQIGVEYLVYGRPNFFRSSLSITHPEVEIFSPNLDANKMFQPVYHTSEKMKNMGLDSKGISKLIAVLLPISLSHINDTLNVNITNKFNLIEKKKAIENIHFPKTAFELDRAIYRLKFEELFYSQLKILRLRSVRKSENRGIVVKNVPILNDFYKNHLPFELTNAQKKVLKEIYTDMNTGKQMNRLLQGDVGSGKTIVAFICMLMLLDQNAQCCLMAPTEILAEQHLTGLKVFADKLNIKMAILTSSTKKSERKILLSDLENGDTKIIVGTHALIEDPVKFKNLGLCVIDEQHKFGVAQRAKLWSKNQNISPHVLVMTATPIPRTLAMSFYGDLDVSIIDELPAGRKPIKTVHRFGSQRLAVYGFIKQEILLGRQIYIVYPLIEESEKMDLQDLYNGYDAILDHFPMPEFQISVVHGRLKPAEKEFEMQRFIKKETQIMLATTVIEVGVNVPNASVMLIENAERFGLAQLHQLRGRVGRGADQSYCILMSGNKVTQDSREKLATLVRTNNGFEIAEADLKLRGPGDLMGTQQSGVLDLLIADLAKDQELLRLAREEVQNLLSSDPNIEKLENQLIKNQVNSFNKNSVNWARIS